MYILVHFFLSKRSYYPRISMLTFDAVCFGQTGNEIVYTDSCRPLLIPL